MTDHSLEPPSSDLVVQAARLVRAVRRGIPQSAGMRVLSLLDEHGPLGVTALAAADQCSQPTMTGLVRQLQDRGWVDRSPHPDDARSSLVALTAAGRAELARVRAANGFAVAERLRAAGHSVDDVATAVAVLRAAVLAPATPNDPTTDPTGGDPA